MQSTNSFLVEKGSRYQICEPVLNIFSIVLSDIGKILDKLDGYYCKFRCSAWEGRTDCRTYDISRVEWVYYGSELKLEISIEDIDDGVLHIELWNSELLALSKISLKTMPWKFDKVTSTLFGFGMNDQFLEDSTIVSNRFHHPYDEKNTVGEFTITLELRAAIKSFRPESLRRLMSSSKLDSTSPVSSFYCSYKNPPIKSRHLCGIRASGDVYGGVATKVKPTIGNQAYISASICKIEVHDSNRNIFRKNVRLVVLVDACGCPDSILYVRGYKPDITSYSSVLCDLNISGPEPFASDCVYSRSFSSFRIEVENVYDGCGVRLGIATPPNTSCCVRYVKIFLEEVPESDDVLEYAGVTEPDRSPLSKSNTPLPPLLDRAGSKPSTKKKRVASSYIEYRRSFLFREPIRASIKRLETVSPIRGPTYSSDRELRRADELVTFHYNNLVPITKAYGETNTKEYIRRVQARMCCDCRESVMESGGAELFCFCLRSDCGLRELYIFKHSAYLQQLLFGLERLEPDIILDKDTKVKPWTPSSVIAN